MHEKREEGAKTYIEDKDERNKYPGLKDQEE